MLVSTYQGLKLYRLPAADKRLDKDGNPRDPKKIGKIHFPVFSPDGLRVVGFMVSLPDIAGMVKRPDRFVALDALDVYEGVLVAKDEKGSFDEAAAKRLSIDLDQCLIWTGMDVRTESGKKVGYCSNVEFNPRSGKVGEFVLNAGATSSMLIGDVKMPPELLRGYAKGAMVVSDEVLQLDLTGGAAAKAAEATVVIGDKVKKGAKVVDEHGSRALDTGSRALGKQLGRAKGMFSGFASEYKKAAGTSKKKAPKKK